MRKRLAVFSESAGRGFRRRRAAFVAIVVLAAAALVWPIYDVFAGVRPFVLGLPFSMAWVIIWILVVFAALLLLFLSERGE